MRAGPRFEGWLTLAVGSVFVAAAAASFAIVAACVSDPACLPDVGEFNLSGIYTLLVAGIAAVFVGAWILRSSRAWATRYP